MAPGFGGNGVQGPQEGRGALLQLFERDKLLSEDYIDWKHVRENHRGETVYQANCAACHGQTGAGIPGAFPAMTGSPIVIGDVAGHVNIVVNGKSGTAMAAFKGQLNDVDLAAVITYERNALGNSVGDMVQPSAIKNAR